MSRAKGADSFCIVASHGSFANIGLGSDTVRVSGTMSGTVNGGTLSGAVSGLTFNSKCFRSEISARSVLRSLGASFTALR